MDRSCDLKRHALLDLRLCTYLYLLPFGNALVAVPLTWLWNCRSFQSQEQPHLGLRFWLWSLLEGNWCLITVLSSAPSIAPSVDEFCLFTPGKEVPFCKLCTALTSPPDSEVCCQNPFPDGDSPNDPLILLSSPGGGLHHRLNGQNRTPKESVSPLDGAWRLPLGQADLYHQLLRYVLSPQELRSCGYPRPNPGDPGRAMWDQPDDDIDPNNPSRRTCCRCGEPFTMTPGGEYTASSPCVYHRGKRGGPGGNYGCCGGEDGCVRSEYHVCARGGDDPDAERGFVRTRSRRGSLQHQGGIYALDCEMCFTKRGLEVARVSVVGADGATVYDSYVQPEHPVLDYNTAFSGVTEEHLKGVRTTLQDVQAVLLRLFSASTVLVGHGLENDLRALKLLHSTVVDTAVVFPHHRGLPYRRSLRSLVSAYLSREVQEGAHDSVEDARACMQLLLWKANKDHKIRERRNRGSGCRLQPSL